MPVIPFRQLKNIFVFSGSTFGHTLNFAEAVKDLEGILSVRKIHLICGDGDFRLIRVVS